MRDDGDVAAQLVQAEVLGEAAADEDSPLGLRQAKERRHERRLSGPGPPHHADLKERKVRKERTQRSLVEDLRSTLVV